MRSREAASWRAWERRRTCTRSRLARTEMDVKADLHEMADGDLLVAGGCRAEAGGCWTAGSGVSPSVEMRRHGSRELRRLEPLE